VRTSTGTGTTSKLVIEISAKEGDKLVLQTPDCDNIKDPSLGSWEF
jgi:hypothetical protein